MQPIYGTHVPHIGHVTGHMIGHVTTSSPMMSGYVSPYGSVVSTPLPSTPLPLLPSYPTLSPTPHPPPSTPPSNSQQHNMARTSPQFQSPTVSSGTASAPLKRSNSVGRGSHIGSSEVKVKSEVHVQAAPPRKDGRRSISLTSSDMPRLSGVSSLYGRPSWWGGDEDEEAPIVTSSGGDSPRKPAKRSEPQILRDISPPLSPSGPAAVIQQSSGGLSAPSLRESAEEAPSDLETGPSAVWTIEVGPRRSKTALPHKLRKQPRSADSSPIRAHHRVGSGGGKTRSVSPSAAPLSSSKTAGTRGGSKDPTPLSQRVTAAKPPSSGSKQRGRQGSSPRPRAASSGSRGPTNRAKHGLKQEKTETSTQSKKSKTTPVAVSAPSVSLAPTEPVSTPSVSLVQTDPPSVSLAQTDPVNSPSVSLVPTGTPPTEKPTSSHGHSSGGVSSASERELKSQSETLLAESAVVEEKGAVDETFLVTSPTTHEEEEERKPSSARKTWNSQPQQVRIPIHSLSDSWCVEDTVPTKMPL